MISTISINFVPATRRISRQRQSRIKLWIAITCAYSVVLVGVFAVYQTMAGSAVQNVDNELAQVNADLKSTSQKISEIKPALNESRLTLQASRAVGNQPDWSVLLALVTSRLNENVVLSFCGLTPQKTSTAPAGVPRVVRGVPNQNPPASAEQSGPNQFTLDVRGLARTQAALSKFVLELEQANLFAKVVLQDAQRVSFAEGDALQFQIVCTLRGGETSP